MSTNFILRTAPFLLLALGLQTSCDLATNSPDKIDVKTVREELRNNLASALDAAEKESAKASTNPLLKLIMLRGDQSVPGEVTDAAGGESLFAPIIAKLLDSPFGRELFAERNIEKQSDNEVIYGAKESLCDTLKGPDDVESGPIDSTTCKMFLATNHVQVRVKSLGTKNFDVALLVTPTAIAKTTAMLLMSIQSGPNMIGQTLNLANLNRFFKSLEGVPEFTKLSGTISWKLQFASEGFASGCRNGESLCLGLNVDEAIDIEGNLGDEFAVKWAASPESHPTLYLSSDQNDALHVGVNVGEISGKVSERDQFFLAGLSFNLKIPSGGDDSAVVIENARMGSKSSWFDAFGKKMTIDFNKAQNGTLELLKVWSQANEVLAEISPFNIQIKMSGELEPGCNADETIVIAGAQSGHTLFKWKRDVDASTVTTETPSLETPSSDTLRVTESVGDETSNCTNSRLMFFGLKQIGVSDRCDNADALSITQGAFKINYDFTLNDQSNHLLLEATEGKCLKPTQMTFANRSRKSFRWRNHIAKSMRSYIDHSGIKTMLAWLHEKAKK